MIPHFNISRLTKSMTDLALLEQSQRDRSRALDNIVFSDEELEIVVQQYEQRSLNEVLIWGGVTFLLSHQNQTEVPILDAHNLLPQTRAETEWLKKKWNIEVWSTIFSVPLGQKPEDMMSKMMFGMTLSSAKSGDGKNYNQFEYMRETKTYQIYSRTHFKPPAPRIIIPNIFVPVFIQGIFYDKEHDIVVMSRDASRVLRMTPINPDKGAIGKAWKERNTDSSYYIQSVYMKPPEDNCMLYYLMEKSLNSTGNNGFIVHLRSENLFNLSRRGFLFDSGSIGGAYMLSTSLPQQRAQPGEDSTFEQFFAVVYRKSDGEWLDVSNEYNFTNANLPPVLFKLHEWGI